MPQSLDCVLLHIIFSTKERYPYIDKTIAPDLYKYMATTIRNLGCECPLIGGVADHVHLAVRLSRTIAIATLLDDVKASTSKWMKSQSPTLTAFAWQRGYGVFSVGPTDQDKLLAYINNQEEHHKAQSFQDEYRAFLKKYRVAYDEKYVWD
jgi:putative transposase